MWFFKCLFFDTDEKSLFHSNIFIIKLIWFSPLILLLHPALYLKKVLTSSCFKQLGQLLKQISWAFGTLFTYLKGWKASLCNDSEGSQITFAFEQWVGWWRWWIFIGECLKEGIPLIIHKPVLEMEEEVHFIHFFLWSSKSLLPESCKMIGLKRTTNQYILGT